MVESGNNLLQVVTNFIVIDWEIFIFGDLSPSWPNVSWVGVAHYALQVRDNILVDSVRPLTYSQPAATNRLVLLNNKLHSLPSSLSSLHTTLFSELNVKPKSPHNFHLLSIISIISVMECIFFYFLVAPSLVSWLGLWCRGSLCTTPPPPPLAATTCHHQNSCLLHISACNGLTKLTRLTPQQQQSAMWSFRNIFTRRNIEIQIYSRHSIHVLVLMDQQRNSQRHFRNWYKSRLQYKWVPADWLGLVCLGPSWLTPSDLFLFRTILNI